jgi:hypothetical protein
MSREENPVPWGTGKTVLRIQHWLTVRAGHVNSVSTDYWPVGIVVALPFAANSGNGTRDHLEAVS